LVTILYGAVPYSRFFDEEVADLKGPFVNLLLGPVLFLPFLPVALILNNYLIPSSAPDRGCP
jgi:hypothetical protein